MIWQSFKPIVWMLLTAAVVLLALWGLVAQDVTQLIVPSPETTAEQLIGALGAHRYEGAMNQLSQDLQQQVTVEDLQSLVKRIEASQARGIQDSLGQSANEHDQQTTAIVQVTLGSNQQVNVELPLIKENGLWKVSSLDPLRGLGQ